jgi:O-antigen/teichoic acid export membrane protein
MVSPEIVTMYSSGLTIYGLYVALPEAINHVFLPQATRMFGDKLPDDDGEKITAFIVRAGRFEAILCLAILGGFTAFGKGFIELWIGIENVNAWYVALLLMIPVTIPMCENLMVTILNATNKRMIRSVILAIMAAINIVLTIVLIPILGYLGAAIGTFLSLTLGHGIMLNIYYHKRFKLKVFSMFKRVYLRLLPCTAIACATTYFLTKWLGKISWIKVSVVGIIYICIYGALVYILYLNDYEKKTLRHMIHLK